MENGNRRSTGRTILLIFAILFSVVFVPVLVFLPPVGGCVTSLLAMTSIESVEKIAEESGLAESVYEMILTETEKGMNSSQLKPEVAERIIADCIRIEDVEQWLKALLEGMYTGDRVKIDLSDVRGRLEENIREVFEGSFDELYDAWNNGTTSEVFSAEYVNTLFDEWENNILDEYAMYGARNMEELELLYDKQYGTGAFAEVRAEKIEEIRQMWKNEIDNVIETEVAAVMTEAEAEVEEMLSEITQDSEIREVFDVLQEADAWSKTASIVIYAILFGIVLLLLLLYVFQVAGFVVTAVPLLLGGAICKLIAAVNEPLLKYMEQEVLSTMNESEEVLSMVRSLIEGVLQPFSRGVSEFGNVVLIAAVILIGCAILRGVLKKNKQEEEASYM